MANGTEIMRVHYSADPTMIPSKILDWRERSPNDAIWQREMEIEWEALEGERLFPEYSSDYNDCEAFEVWDPEYWTMYHACDPHGRTPNSFLWVAANKNADWVICGELWAQNPEGKG